MSEDADFVDVFAPAWREGYVIGRKELGSGALETALERAGASGHVSVLDGHETGRREALELPHRVLVVGAPSGVFEEEREVTLPVREFARAEIGFYTGDPVVVRLPDVERRCVGRVVGSNLASELVTVFLERVEPTE